MPHYHVKHPFPLVVHVCDSDAIFIHFTYCTQTIELLPILDTLDT